MHVQPDPSRVPPPIEITYLPSSALQGKIATLKERANAILLKKIAKYAISVLIIIAAALIIASFFPGSIIAYVTIGVVGLGIIAIALKMQKSSPAEEYINWLVKESRKKKEELIFPAESYENKLAKKVIGDDFYTSGLALATYKAMEDTNELQTQFKKDVIERPEGVVFFHEKKLIDCNERSITQHFTNKNLKILDGGKVYLLCCQTMIADLTFQLNEVYDVIPAGRLGREGKQWHYRIVSVANPQGHTFSYHLFTDKKEHYLEITHYYKFVRKNASDSTDATVFFHIEGIVKIPLNAKMLKEKKGAFLTWKSPGLVS